MKSLLTASEIGVLLQEQQSQAVSLYMPLVRSGSETRQNSIRFTNLLREANRRLEEEGMRANRVREFLSPLQALADDPAFLNHPQEGLAIFHSQATSRVYRLPVEFAERVTTGRRFFVKPLFRLLMADGRFLILALSQRGIRLYQATRYQIAPIETVEIPPNLEEALKLDDLAAGFQYRMGTSASQGSTPGGAHQPSVFLAHGGLEVDGKDLILRYFRKVDAGLREILREDRAPLLLAGLDFLLPIYREANTYPYLAETGLAINPHDLPLEELHRRSWSLVEPMFTRTFAEHTDLYRRLAGEKTGLVSNDLPEVITAAWNSRVSILWVVENEERWGNFDPRDNSVRIHPQRRLEDQDLLDAAAAYTLLNGGTVYAVPLERMPGPGLCAAVFRYPAS